MRRVPGVRIREASVSDVSHHFWVPCYMENQPTNRLSDLDGEEEDWNLDDEGVSVGECDRCFQVRPVLQCNDPFLEGVYGEHELGAWCRPCFLERKDQV